MRKIFFLLFLLSASSQMQSIDGDKSVNTLAKYGIDNVSNKPLLPKLELADITKFPKPPGILNGVLDSIRIIPIPFAYREDSHAELLPLAKPGDLNVKLLNSNAEKFCK